MKNDYFSGKTVLVTGGSRGIGRAVCTSYAALGASVVINYAGNKEAAEETLSLCRETGARAIMIKADVSNAQDVKSLVEQAAAEFGTIDILVNNAGITKDNLMLRMSEKDFDDVVSINLKGTFLCMKEVSKLMIKNRTGRIVNISSVAGIAGNAGQANYAASKAGIIGLTKSMAKELASRGITVNAVAPGLIETDMTNCLSDELKNKLVNSIPLKRLGTPIDVANAVLFFTEENTAYITGQILQVDGGLV